MSFNNLGLQDSLLRALKGTGYTHPTPIQEKAIPAILTGSDVMAAAQTGTGKTAGFTLPLLQLLGKGKRARSNHVRALVLTPTRELAAQVEDSVRTYGAHENLHSVVVFGGVSINPQMMAMRKGADILVATPGRLLDMYQQKAVHFDDLEVLIMDEADRMLDMGFINDIKRILKLLPAERQNLMFSATFSNDIRTLAKTICRHPVEIDVAPRNSTVDAISQRVYLVKKEDKISLLVSILKATPDQSLVFSRTKHGANKLVKVLTKNGLNAVAIHGNKSQNQRTKALGDFKANKVQVMVATDIAARGIDIDQLAQVINFDLPNVSEDYVHRIGRTGRAGASGLAVSLVSPEENGLLRDIERLIKRKIDNAELPAFTSVSRDTSDADSAARHRSRPATTEVTAGTPKRRRRPATKSRNASGSTSAGKSAQGQHRNRVDNNADNDKQEAAPKRRRRSRNKNRTGQDNTVRSESGNRQTETAGSAKNGHSTVARIKRFFGGKKVA